MDSSDEEWGAAYGALDPLSQLGWDSRRAVQPSGVADIVRDVFVVADLLHEDTMSQMGGDANNVSEGVAGTDGGDGEYSGSDGEACMEDNRTEVGSDEGDQWSQAMFYAIACCLRGTYAMVHSTFTLVCMHVT